MSLGTIAQINRYPVKSMGGELLDEIAISVGGLRGDRAWAVRDEINGGIRGGKKIPALMGLQSRYVKSPAEVGSSAAEIALPDGTLIETSDPEINKRRTESLGHAVTLWPILPAETVDHYLRGAPTHEDFETELRSIFGRLPDEPLPDLGAFPPEILQYESPPGTYFDAFPLLVMTEESIQSLQASAPDSRIDVRRFRPNLLVSATDTNSKYPEQDWIGRQVRIGEAVIKIEMTCPRCVMTTHGFEDLPKDPHVMRKLVQEAGGNLGVYCSIDTPGIVRSGDTIEFVD